MAAGDLSLGAEEVGAAGSLTEIKELYLPAIESEAEMLSGSPDEISGRVLDILKEKGGIS